ncbi:DUF4328 domain-containing protein [bacterium]|nr:DUF4328 domain-containing protein [bacterium]
MQAELLSRATFSAAEAEANDFREQIIGLFYFSLYLLTAVIFGCWIVRANKNARALGADDLRITPGWAVGYFFVPILNLWRPYQAMKGLWQASHSPSSWTSLTASPILPAWWTLWLVSSFVSQAAFRAAMDTNQIDDPNKIIAGLKTATFLDIASASVEIPLCLVAMFLVTQITHAQKTHVENDT